MRRTNESIPALFCGKCTPALGLQVLSDSDIAVVRLTDGESPSSDRMVRYTVLGQHPTGSSPRHLASSSLITGIDK